MWSFNYFKKKREKEEQERRHAEEQAYQQKLEEERIACERELWLEENRCKELERQENLKAEREQAESLQPFTFKSNCHQRYENSSPVKRLQECLRTVSVVKNKNGHPGYRLQPGIGYIVQIYNDDLDKPNMSDKPMRVVRKTDTSIELRGFPIEAQSPFGWQQVDYSDYGLIVYYEHGKVSKCVLHMYDRNIFIEYRFRHTQPLKTTEVKDSSICECEQYAQMAKKAAETGNTSMAQQYGFKVYESIVSDPSQTEKINNVGDVALALGKLMEGEYFTDNDSILKAVGLTYYFLCKAIETTSENDPYLYVYRFSTIWEYNKAFYNLFAHAEGRNYNPNPFDMFGQASTAVYDHHMQGMQMADVLIEPRIKRLAPALGNIFDQMYARYSSAPSEQIINLGNEYHEQVYTYLKQKVESKDFNF
ncbi:hypothetical protein [Bacteroides pyogenes]|uniref:hypothetical protein n=1 Tax=Bacteroides pyogenes TaxID=310300 RepID=UPI002A7F36D4|nr:hypothetical protein [Bacteroides pyogenes]MDY4250428.1 hypothetical protein [Bacteroides pyogenes]